jgi:hypothetical protein
MARTLGLARNLKQLADSFIPLFHFVKFLSNVILEIEQGRKIHSQAEEITLLSEIVGHTSSIFIEI